MKASEEIAQYYDEWLATHETPKEEVKLSDGEIMDNMVWVPVKLLNKLKREVSNDEHN